MTAHQRVMHTRSLLQLTAGAVALLWGSAITLLALSVIELVQRFRVGGVPLRPALSLAIALGLITCAMMLWRGRFARFPRLVAVWIEERIPELQYALITASDPDITQDTAALELAVQQAGIEKVITLAMLRPVARAAAAVIAAAIALLVASNVTGARLKLAGHSALARVGISTPLPNRLASLRVRVVSPAYAGSAARVIDDPSGVSALVGSTVTVMGVGGRDGISGALQGRDFRARGVGDAWELGFAMPERAAALSLTDREYRRVMAIIPVIDHPPSVTLTTPTRDTVWRTPPTAALELAARAMDDIGLDHGYFEYTVTSGAGEIFKARTVTFGASRFGGSSRAEMRVKFPLTPLKLGAGDVLSVRAVVSDANTLTGPGNATSDTRTFRVARADEYDSLAVEGAPPPPVERSMLTERMLIISAESLLKQRAALGQKTFVSSSEVIGVDQASLRKKVYDIVYGHEEAGGDKGVEGDDEEVDPQIVINRDLKEAYDAMWDAERALMVGEVTPALPSMQKALRALDRARLANRLYLRGRSPRVVVNIEKVRLVGKDKGSSNSTTPRSRADTVTAQLRAAFDQSLELTHTNPAGFADELTRLRAESFSFNSAFSSALGDAVDAIRAGSDATPALVRARRSLSGPVRIGGARLPWAGAWGGAR